MAAIVSVCQSMHSVWSAKNKDAYRFDLNPAALACTCKGFRMTSICSHVLAGTVLLQNELDTEGTYGRPFLESLVEKLVTTFCRHEISYEVRKYLLNQITLIGVNTQKYATPRNTKNM